MQEQRGLNGELGATSDLVKLTMHGLNMVNLVHCLNSEFLVRGL